MTNFSKSPLLIVFISFISFSQNIDLGSYDFTIKKINLTSTTTAKLGASINYAPSGYKFLIIKGLFSPKYKKGNSISISDFIIKINDEDFYFQSPSTLGMDLNFKRSGTNTIRIRRPKKKRIVTIIPKNAKSGMVYYKEKKIGEILINQKTKEATFNPI